MSLGGEVPRGFDDAQNPDDSGGFGKPLDCELCSGRFNEPRIARDCSLERFGAPLIDPIVNWPN